MNTATLLSRLRRWHLRRLVALIAVFAVFGGSLAQAAHFHKNEGLRGAETHLQCQLCMHADRWAGPPELPQHNGPSLTVRMVIAPLPTAQPGRAPAGFYDARGPPLV
ncbi:MAG TPA: hypothetical protein VHN17_10980 [Steroidobacteraceae bacterium]|nr:hypothetical protein [Steroidobacteraceae bacterium]